MFLKTIKVAIFICKKIQSRIIYHFNSAFCFCIIHKRKIGKGNFRRHQRTRNFRLRFFDRTVSNYSPDSFALLVGFLERCISRAFFGTPCDSMRQKQFWCDFLRFVSICFTLFTLHVVPRIASEAPAF